MARSAVQPLVIALRPAASPARSLVGFLDRSLSNDFVNRTHPATSNPEHPAPELRMALDVGNSAVKWALGRPGQELQERPLAFGRVVIRGAVDDWPASIPWPVAPAEVFIGSVHRPTAAVLQGYLKQHHPQLNPCWLTADLVPIQFDVRAPERVGIDRVLSAWAAWLLSGSATPTITVDAGSAVTVDLVSDGCFRGGAILPGISLMLESLARGTDLLPQLQPHVETWPSGEVPGRDTVAAIRCGVANAVLGAVERLIEQYVRGLARVAEIVVTGGDGPWLAQTLHRPCQCVPDIILRAILHLPASVSQASVAASGKSRGERSSP